MIRHSNDILFYRDNREVDIVGANLYQRYINTTGDSSSQAIPQARKIPETLSSLQPSTVRTVQGILVRTGVYQEQSPNLSFHSHRDFTVDDDLLNPHHICDDIEQAIDFVLELESKIS